MGILFFKSKKGNDFAKQLEDMDSKIKDIEDRLVLSREFQKKLKYRMLLYSIVLEIVIAIYTYIRIKSIHFLYDKLVNSIFLIIIPVFIYIIYKSFNYIFTKYMKKNEHKLDKLKKDLQKKLDERKRETDFEATQKLIDKYEKKKRDTPSKNSNNNNNNNANNSNNLNSPSRMNKPINGANTLTYRGPTQTLQQQSNSPNRPIYNKNPSTSSPQVSSHPTPLPPPQPIFQAPPPVSNHWFDKIVDFLLADGPKYGAPLICTHCHSHNGYVPTEELPSIQFRCRFCHEFNQKGSSNTKPTTVVNDNNNNNNNNSNSSNNEDDGQSSKKLDEVDRETTTTVTLEKKATPTKSTSKTAKNK
ncbi:transmembrane protein [Tieghemostelium lacteum]|uniref:Endoplasmic reticulum junction formation protein lunapark n=1 Tax=Tieghemostelium lacteum TaxID=361077 RepID=A0A151ZCJ2_TIELA|nr:transmembrane protein [Tieghemostelium lacteum]|eukprot:KYQ91594.1 transmembrane protein [Tieghemostelium lacteum]